MSDVVLRVDLYPARLFVASTSFLAVRVTVDASNVTAWRMGPSGPEVQYQRDITGEIEGSVAGGYVIPTSAGDVWVESTGGCACGAALANADLFPGQTVSRTSLR